MSIYPKLFSPMVQYSFTDWHIMVIDKINCKLKIPVHQIYLRMHVFEVVPILLGLPEIKTQQRNYYTKESLCNKETKTKV